MQRLTHILVTALGSLALGTAASAATIAEYNFDGDSFASQVTAGGVTTSSLSNGAGVPLTTVSQGNPAPSLEFSFGTVGANLAASIADDDYYSFTITPAGTQVTFNQFDFDFFKTSNAGANVQAVLFYDTGTYSTSTHTQLGIGQLTGTGDSGSFVPRSISLASMPVNFTTPVEFRLYIHDSNASNQANVFRLDNLVLDATVVPEPSAGLLALLAMPLLARRRRK